MQTTALRQRYTYTYSSWTIFLIFLRLGLTSFGGPIAHLGYFREEFVTRRRWLSDSACADLVALCQFLPGPASSQVGMAIGFYRSGYMGAPAAWVGFTLPSAIVLILFAKLIEVQVIKGEYYRNLSENNRIRIVPIPAPRGKILAGGGEVLAGNIDVKKRIVFGKNFHIKRFFFLLQNP